MKTLKQLLQAKPHGILSTAPDARVFDALKLMAENNVGALLVMDAGQLVGIVTERDYARKVILKGKSSKQTLVSEIMSSPVIYVTPQTTVEECMKVVTLKRIRHLPVVENSRVLGVVSIGDLVKSIISEQEATIQQLHAYIAGNYPG